VITAARPAINAGCCAMSLLLLPARRVEIHCHVLALGEAVEHHFQGEFAADAALLEAAIGVAGC